MPQLKLLHTAISASMKISTPHEHEKSFNAMLYDCIDGSLKSILGEDGVSTFYYAIEQKFEFPKS